MLYTLYVLIWYVFVKVSLLVLQKIEIIDDEESDMISNSEVEQENSLLDYKNEEVRFIENELEIQKQKYFKLQSFVRNLILAMKADDKDQQQALLSDLPPELEEMDCSHASPDPDDTSLSVSSLSEKNASDSLWLGVGDMI